MMKLSCILFRMLENSSERYKGVLAVVGLAIVYGIMPLLPRYLSVSFDLLPQVYLRLVIAAALCVFFFRGHLHFEKLRTLPRREWGLLALRAALYYLLGVVLYTQAILITKITNVLLIDMIPLTAIFGFILLKEPFSFKKAGLIALSVGGVCIVGMRDTSSLLTFGMGEAVALLSAAFMALAFISRRWHSNILNDREIATYTLFFAALMVFVVSLMQGDPLPTSGWGIGPAVVLLIGGILNVLISFFLNYGLSRVDSVLTGNILTTQIAFAAFFAYIAFGEVPLQHEIVGGLVIVVAAIALDRISAPKK